jgi:ATP-dependent DNA helicase RecG
MRPDKLFALFSDVTRLKGVGPGAKKALGRLFYNDENATTYIRDVLFHLPVSVIDRRNSPTLKTAKDGDIVTLIVKVETHQAPPRRRGVKQPYKIICHTKEGYLTLVFFHARSDYIAGQLPAGEERVISGRFERYGAVAQITHPDIIAPVTELKKIQVLEPIYGLTGGLTNRHLRKIIESGLQLLPDLPEWINEAYKIREEWKSWKQALKSVHNPEKPEDIFPGTAARLRLAYDEILANQLALALVRKRLRKTVSSPIVASSILREKIMGSLPYQLTAGQTQVLKDIDEDMASGNRMLRLLQGDVGSGKTIVALLAMLSVVEAGKQAALMVPTELLSRQHLKFIERIAAPGVRVQLLIGGMKAKEYNDALTRIASGDVDIVIGTHALFQDKVIFKELALAVIDEQHRFGVAQRMALTAKSKDTHVLVMTATPIPRTLTMTAFGDMDCSILAEKPIGRQEIATKAIPLSRADDVLEGIARATAKGEKVYWICPLVEESEDENAPSDLAAADMRYKEFLHRFGPHVGMVHGRIDAAERDRVMLGFASGEYNILVATTVVEVGVDVPDATIIVIEHAERFGLSQLHQLRGRVGRSDKPSVCILLYTDRCNDIAKSRLHVIRETNDGFRIAEEDLKLRGSGDILGTRQSGLPDFHFADLAQHYDLLRAAYDDAKLILHNDPKLESPRGQALRCLLYLFKYDKNIRFLDAG